MQGLYDEEIDSGEGELVLVVCVFNKGGLGISAGAIRMCQTIKGKSS